MMLRKRRMDEESYRKLGEFLIASVPYEIAAIVVFYLALLAHSFAVRSGLNILATVSTIVMLSLTGITFLLFLAAYVYWRYERISRARRAAPVLPPRPRRARKWLTGPRGRRT
jgi:hypothetical protein